MDSHEMISIAETLVEGARSDSVTVSRLTNGENKLLGGGGISHEPVITYLIEDEQPHFIFQLNPDSTISISGPEGTAESNLKDSLGPNLAGWLVITNMRILIIVNAPEKDDVISIPLSMIGNEAGSIDGGVEISSHGFLSHKTKMKIQTSDYSYELPKPNGITEEAVSYIRNKSGVNQPNVEESHTLGETDTVFICKKCEQEVPSDARKCPHCGYYPGKGGKGALWHGTALATSFSPIGWAMMAKGTADEVRTRRGVAREKTIRSKSSESEEINAIDSIDKIARLSKLRDDGVISDEEFETKKAELLDQI